MRPLPAVAIALLGMGCSSNPPGDAPPDAGVSTDAATLDAADAAPAADAGACSAARTRDLWLWGDTVQKSPSERAAFFAFADAHAVRTVYAESEALLDADPASPALAAFIAEAKTHCIDVELLFGRPSWALAAEHARPVALTQAAVTFTNGLVGARPVGVHFDVEPYLVPAWTTDQALVAGQYVDLLAELRAALGASTLRLVVDIAFWFETVSLARNATTRPLDEWVIDAVDVTTLMDYRDTAPAILAGASQEMPYAGTHGKRVVIGVETMCGLSDGPTVTFCEEGQKTMDTTLAAVAAQYGAAPAFGGFAVHHYVSWKALGP